MIRFAPFVIRPYRNIIQTDTYEDLARVDEPLLVLGMDGDDVLVMTAHGGFFTLAACWCTDRFSRVRVGSIPDEIRRAYERWADGFDYVIDYRPIGKHAHRGTE